MSMKQVNKMHILLLGPSLLYIGNLTDYKLQDNNNKFIDFIFNSLITYSFMIPFIVRINFKDLSTYRKIINLTHYIFFMWLFLYIGLKGRNINYLLRKISSLIGITMISVHLYYYFFSHNEDR